MYLLFVLFFILFQLIMVIPNIRIIYSQYILGKLAAYLLAAALEQCTTPR